MTNKPRVYISAGATKEPLDDVRFVTKSSGDEWTNFSSGKFGIDLARAFVDLGYPVTVFGSREAKDKMIISDLALEIEYWKACVAQARALEGGANAKNVVMPQWLFNHVEFKPFTTTESLGALLDQIKPSSIVFNAAAVADFAPTDVVEGKIRSDVPGRDVHMERTPKLVSQLRAKFGSSVLLVGFKLLSGVPKAELIDAAVAQLHNNQLDFVVSNDLRELEDDWHPITIVSASGNNVRIDGKSARTAEWVAHFTETAFRLSSVDAAVRAIDHELHGMDMEAFMGEMRARALASPGVSFDVLETT